MAKRIIYHPPPRHVLEDYARRVCKRLAEMGDLSFTTPEVVDGFTEFLELATTIWAKHLSSESEQNDEPLDSNGL